MPNRGPQALDLNARALAEAKLSAERLAITLGFAFQRIQETRQLLAQLGLTITVSFDLTFLEAAWREFDLGADVPTEAPMMPIEPQSLRTS